MKPVLLLFMSFFSCSCEPELARRAQSPIPVCVDDGARADLTVLTYNAGLGPGIDLPYYAQRVAPAVQAVADYPADVICLNEIWTDEAKAEVVAKLGLPRGQVYMVDTRGRHETGTDRCEPGQMDRVLGCARSNCSGLPDEEVTRCIVDKCQASAGFTWFWHRPCFRCLIASPGKTIDQLERDCYGGSVSRMYEGRNGIVLASRLPMSRLEWIDLPSTAANRVALFATVDVRGSKIEVACTHLSGRPKFVFPDDPKYPYWPDEMIAQLDPIAEHLERRANGRPQLLLGDLNTGPSFAGERKTVESSVWDEIVRLGFDCPAAATVPPICSRCSTNLLTQTDAHILIDHVLTRDADELEPVCAVNVFDQPIPVKDLQGQEIMSSRSDHDGIVQKFKFRSSPPLP